MSVEDIKVDGLNVIASDDAMHLMRCRLDGIRNAIDGGRWHAAQDKCADLLKDLEFLAKADHTVFEMMSKLA